MTQPAEAAVYRAEVSVQGAPGSPPVPWMVSNPLYVLPAGRTRNEPELPPEPRTFMSLFADEEDLRRQIERSQHAQAALDVVRDSLGRQLLFRYALGGSRSESPYAAVSFPVTGVSQADRVMFTGRASHPMRIGVQLRAAGSETERWQRSVYLDESPRTVSVYFDDMRATAADTSGPPPLDRIDSLLFVVDTLNTALGSSGQVWIDELKLAK
jgi:hypothetical protein